MLTTGQQAKMEKWLTALESGDYKQGNGTLKRLPHKYEDDQAPAYCCLGIAAEAALGKQFLPSGLRDDLTLQYGSLGSLTTGRGVYDLAPPEQAELGLDKVVTFEEAGLIAERCNTVYELDTFTANEFLGQKRMATCIQMNDTLKYDFKQIAQAIRDFGWDKG